MQYTSTSHKHGRSWHLDPQSSRRHFGCAQDCHCSGRMRKCYFRRPRARHPHDRVVMVVRVPVVETSSVSQWREKGVCGRVFPASLLRGHLVRLGCSRKRRVCKRGWPWCERASLSRVSCHIPGRLAPADTRRVKEDDPGRHGCVRGICRHVSPATSLLCGPNPELCCQRLPWSQARAQQGTGVPCSVSEVCGESGQRQEGMFAARAQQGSQ